MAPTAAEQLPIARQLLPSEYGIDPTGTGGVLGLAEMGGIKAQLSKEAEADRLMMDATIKPQSSLQPAADGCDHRHHHRWRPGA